MKILLTTVLLILASIMNAQENTTPYTASSGWTKVYQDNQIGYLDEMGIEIIPAVYDSIGDFDEYCTDMAIVVKNGLMGLIDTNGYEIVKTQYEMIARTDKFKAGWIMVMKDKLYGYINCTGEEIVKPIYSKIEELNNTPIPAY